MRALTSEELGQCAGGIETVTVVASRITFSWSGGGYSYDDGRDQYDSSNPRTQSDYTQEEVVDGFAYAIQQDILAQSDHNEREYATVIYWDPASSEIRALPLTRGQTVSEATLLNPNGGPPETRISLADTNGGHILAIIHSHPDIGYDSAEDERNREPSPGDDQLAYDLIRTGRAAADEFAHYIVGPDGKLREYDY